MTPENFPFQTTPQTFREVGQALARIKRTLLYNNYSATSAPTANDDVTLGYEIGSTWINLTTDNVYICADATDGAAVWVLASPGSGSGPLDATYVTLSTNATLTNERVLTSTTSITVVDGGAGSTVTLQRAALTGDATASANSNALTLATVNANVGTFGSATQVGQFTVNAKGLITAAANVSIVAPVATAITVANEATDTTCFLVFTTAATGDLAPKTNANLAFNSNTGVLTLTAPILGTPTSGTLTNCTGLPTILVADTTDSSCFIAMFESATGELGPKTDGGLTYNASTGALTATSFVGPLTGNASTVTVANEATDTTCFPLFGVSATGSLEPKTNVNLTFNSNTGALGASSLTLVTPLTVPNGGTGAATLTGILEGNGTSAVTAVDSSTVGQVLRCTGSSTFAFGAVDLADTDAVTGELPLANQQTSGTIIGSISAVLAPTSSYATQDIRPTGDTPIIPMPVWDFDASATEYMAFKVFLHPDYGGNGLTITIQWSASSATTGTCRWECAFRAFENNATLDDIDDAFTYDFNGVSATAPSAGTGTSTGSGVTRYSDITFSDGSDMDSVSAGEFAILLFRRKHDHADDNMSGDAEMHEFVIKET